MNRIGTDKALDPRRAVPIILGIFLFSLIIDNGFKFMTKAIQDDLALSAAQASLQATLAGLVIGIGAVVYAALADSVSMKKLLYLCVILIAVGGVIGFAFSGSYAMVVIARLIQTTGLAAGETLYVIYVTKYLPAAQQKTYLGFSTAAFQASTLFGAVASGFVATYVSWAAMFVIPVIMVLSIPIVKRTVPPTEAVSTRFDALGLFIIAVTVTGVLLFLQAFNPLYLIVVAVGIVAFVWHICRHDGALVRPEFFRNKRFSCIIALVFIVYSVQLGYIILVPYIGDKVYHLSTDEASLLLAPGYACAIVVGCASGWVGRHLSSRLTIIIALFGIVAALAIAAVGIEVGRAVLMLSIVFFPSSFASSTPRCWQPPSAISPGSKRGSPSASTTSRLTSPCPSASPTRQSSSTWRRARWGG
ncbi:MFS transporter [Nanchangia anserum]|uniref:MFS transporter n=1 Tax=Nanchangia anserum TaxID=2692125 RepID=UPI001D10187C|nr:MFS transporter [Nanchangia anserum]